MSKETKTLETNLVVNWKEESLRTRKTKPSSREKSPYEFIIPVNIDVVVPEIDTATLDAAVEVPQVAVESGLRAEEAEHVDPSDWQDVADELIDEYAREGSAWDFETVSQLTGEVLTQVEVYPDPSEVKSYISSEYGAAVRERRAEA